MKKTSIIYRISAIMLLLITNLAADSLDIKVLNGRDALYTGPDQKAYIWVGLTGKPVEGSVERPPVNVALVIDRSGSMQGEKLAKAREAAVMAVQRLRADDIVSVVIYDTRVEVIVPATKAVNKRDIISKINRIFSGGSTALYDGVQKGASEIRKFITRNKVNRLILLSDGLANVGPQSPSELGRLGAELIQEGISVTTIGLGLQYNEDLMANLAYKSDGSHYFAEQASDLASAFNNEFGRALSVVAQELHLKIKCIPGVRPVRILGRDHQVNGQNVTAFINQLYSENEKYFILEVELMPGTAVNNKKLADVSITYLNMFNNKSHKYSSQIIVDIVQGKTRSDQTINKRVMADVVELQAIERNEKAMRLRDKGKIAQAKKLLLQNADFLSRNAQSLDSEKLREYSADNKEESENLDEQNWIRTKKGMIQKQFSKKRK